MSEISTQQDQQDAEIHPVLKSTSDFSDRLSPMLVKELRQGLKGYGFMLLFMAIQAILALYILGASFADTYNNTGHEISRMVFYLLSIATLIAQPLRGMSAISGEIKENTIELMVMTRLSAWRIAFGKWISIVSQSALLIAAVTPYLIVRYFFGGMQLFPEIMVLISIFLLSASFTAITIGLSAIPSFILRGIVSAGIAIAVFATCTEIFDSRREYQDLLNLVGFTDSTYSSIYFILLLSAGYLGWLALDFGASYIAPVAENRATPRRLIALGLIIFSSTVIFYFSASGMEEAIPAIATLLAIPVCVISLTEPTFLVPNVSASFLRRGIAISSSRFILYPGWQSGIWYTLLLYLIATATITFIDPRHQMEALIVITIAFSTIIFPLAITKLFFSKKHLFTCYISIALASAVISMITFTLIEVTNAKEIATYMCWLPPVQFYLFYVAQNAFYGNPLKYTESFILSLTLGCGAVYWIICVIRSIPEWRIIRKNEQVTKAMLDSISSNQS